MGINGLMNLLQNAKRSRMSLGKQFMQFAQEVAQSKTATRTRISLSGEDLQLLPKPVRDIIIGVKNPTVHIGIKSGNGTSTIGAALSSGNKPVARVAFGVDTTVGTYPAFQTRMRINLPNAQNERVMSGAFWANPNLQIGEDFSSVMTKRGDTYLFDVSRGKALQVTATMNPERGVQLGRILGQEITPNARDMQRANTQLLDDSESIIEDLKRIFKVKKTKVAKPAQLSAATETTAKTARRAKAALTERSFAQEVREILAMGEKATPESVEKAKNLIARKMGFDPDTIRIEFKGLGSQGGYFDSKTGIITLDSGIFATRTNFDVTNILVHELDHMEAFVKTAKKMGLDKYEKLMLELEPGSTLNRSFYEEAMKQVDVKGFSAKPFIKSLKETDIRNKNFTGDYLNFYDNSYYAIDAFETRARGAEIRLFQELQTSGVKFDSSIPIEHFSEATYKRAKKYYEMVQAKIGKLPPEKQNEVFNEAFAKVLKSEPHNSEIIADDEYAAFLDKVIALL